MTDLKRPLIERSFIIEELKTVMAKLRAMELALTGLKKAQALSDTDMKALEFIATAAHCDVGELCLALENEQDGGSNG
ncbi:hypothetical protein WOC76_15495 [Methylocystis sp. IM3]|uniref:hypothetical protein n=1 Tax=unclassified Methylocystis TaxID=2625913 RepID=UPI00311A60A1